MLVYTVTVRFPSEELMEDFLGWLEDDHMAEVVAAGAEDGEGIVLDSDEFIAEARYRFASREAFAEYDAGPARTLRSEASQRFVERGAHFERSTGLSRIRRD